MQDQKFPTLNKIHGKESSDEFVKVGYGENTNVVLKIDGPRGVTAQDMTPKTARRLAAYLTQVADEQDEYALELAENERRDR